MKPGKLQKAGLLFRFWGWTGLSRDPDPAYHIKNHIKTCNGVLFFHQLGKVWKTLNRRSFEYEISEN